MCQTVPGAGAALYVSVTVAGQAAPAFLSTAIAYRPPSMTSLSGRTSLAGTPGGDLIVITGDQFGPVSTLVPGVGYVPLLGAAYGKTTDVPLRYAAVACAVTTADTTITCQTAPGTGAGLVWQVTVAGQSSAILSGYSTSYAPPVIASFSGPGAFLANTYVYETVSISGACTPCAPIRASYKHSSAHSASSCRRELRACKHDHRLCRLLLRERHRPRLPGLRARDSPPADMVQHLRWRGHRPELDRHECVPAQSFLLRRVRGMHAPPPPLVQSMARPQWPPRPTTAPPS